MKLPRLFSLAVAACIAVFSGAFTANGQTPTTADRFIIVFDAANPALADPAEVESAAIELASLHSGTVESTFSRTFKGFVGSFTESAAAELARHPNVSAIEKDAPIYAAQTQTGAIWSLDRLDQRNLPLRGNYNYDTAGTGVNVYVIDSGIRGSHSEFGGRVSYPFDSINDGMNGVDCYGHGTHVAGTVGGATYGVAKNAQLHSMRVLGCTGTGSVSGLLNAIEWITVNRQDPAVVNISITINAAFSIIDDAVNASVASGVTYVISAANHGADACNYSPGRASRAITVGATLQDDSRPSWSNYGACVDIFAPGGAILSAGIADDVSTSVKSGTSMASPHVAGAAALVLEQQPQLSPDDVAAALFDNSSPAIVTNRGAGSPDRMLYSILSDTSPTTITDVAPDGGLAVVGSTQTITWNNRGDYNSRVSIELSTDGGLTFPTTIASNIDNTGSFDWSVPYMPTSQGRLRVRETAREMPADATSGDLVITLAPTSASVPVSGVVVTADGTGIGGVTVTLTSQDGEVYRTTSNSFGYFVFDSVPVGGGYVLSLGHKRYFFSERLIDISEAVTDIVITIDD